VWADPENNKEWINPKPRRIDTDGIHYQGLILIVGSCKQQF
jgi:hypothetical protein